MLQELFGVGCVDWVTEGRASVVQQTRAGASSVVLEQRVGCLLAAVDAGAVRCEAHGAAGGSCAPSVGLAGWGGAAGASACLAARERRAGCVAGAPDRTRAPSLMPCSAAGMAGASTATRAAPSVRRRAPAGRGCAQARAWSGRESRSGQHGVRRRPCATMWRKDATSRLHFG